MGCSSSKLDDLPAVQLCRYRCDFLNEAIQVRFKLSESHFSYLHSLTQVGHSLHHFMIQQQTKHDQTKAETEAQVEAKAAHFHSRSSSGHLLFDSDSDSGSENSTPLHHLDDGGESYYVENMMRMNYMMSRATPPSVVYHHHQPLSSSPEREYLVGESSTSSSVLSSASNLPYPYPYFVYSSYNYGDKGGVLSEYHGSPQPHRMVVASSSRQPPPPPSGGSVWDFINPFESNERQYYPEYVPSRHSKELEEEEEEVESIPHLEEEDEEENQENNVVKEVRKNIENYSKKGDNEADEAVIGGNVGGGVGDVDVVGEEVPIEKAGIDYEVHVMEKKKVDDEKTGERRSSSNARDASEVASEIKAQFLRAAESGNVVAKMLEVGKLPYKHKHASSKMSRIGLPSRFVLSSRPTTSKSSEAGPALLVFEEEVAMRSGNLSSTLQKLYLWEKKLYNEVKGEEKMRVVHDRKVHKLRRLDQRGVESHKVESTRTSVRSLSTRIRMAIEVVDKISVTINKIRDEELWPQLNELIRGLTQMWKEMLECHCSQFQMIKEAKGLGPMKSVNEGGDARLDSITWQLEHDVVNWTVRFSNWIDAQKGFVKALNNWLLKCLLYEPEETTDGIAPFSPGRIGAPPVFVICNQWSQAMERISEREVIDSMRTFTKCLLWFFRQDKVEMHERMIGDKDLERKAKNLDREDVKIRKEIEELGKRLEVASEDDKKALVVDGNIVYHGDTSSGDNSLQQCIERIFEAMEKFTADSLKVYEELVQRAEEEEQRISQEHEKPQ